MKESSGVPRQARLETCLELQASIFLRGSDSFAGRPLHHEIVSRARAAGLAGATAVRGLQGFGSSARLRAPGLIGFNGSEPVLVDIAGQPDRITAFLLALEPLLRGSLVVSKVVTVTRSVADVPDIAATAGG